MTHEQPATSDPTIICPKCQTPIRLTESLAAPLIDAARAQFEVRAKEREQAVAEREVALKTQQTELERLRASIDEQVAERLKTARAGIADEEAKKARLVLAADLDKKTLENAELLKVIEQRDAKLTEAAKVEAEALRKQRSLDDAMRELEITIEKRVQDSLAQARQQAQQQSDEQNRLKIAEKEKTINDLQAQLAEALRKAEQGSQQLQGEVQELDLEALLRAKFPRDTIEPVPKGEHGGDVLHRVLGPLGQACGTILWESKRTKNWSDTWLPKLRDDQRAAKAEVAVIVTQALPDYVETFDLIDHVWVTDPRSALPVAVALRHALIEVGMARQAGEGQLTKMEFVYEYLTGPRFRQRLLAIAEAFTTMRKDLDKERKAIMAQWAKREKQIDRAMEATAGMYGELQGIAGQSLQEIEELELKTLQDKETNLLLTNQSDE